MSPFTFIMTIFFALSMTGSAFITSLSRARSNSRSFSLSFSPTDITDVGSLVLAKNDVKTLSLGAIKKVEAGRKILNPDVGAQVLSDGSHAVMDFPNVFNPKLSKLKIRYAQVIGRLMILGIGFLPHHGFQPEELTVQLFLLGVSMKPVMRSIKLYRCIASSKCIDECELELHDLESSLP